MPTYPAAPAVKKAVSPDDELKTLSWIDSVNTGLVQSLSVKSAESIPDMKRSILKQNVPCVIVTGILYDLPKKFSIRHVGPVVGIADGKILGTEEGTPVG